LEVVAVDPADVAARDELERQAGGGRGAPHGGLESLRGAARHRRVPATGHREHRAHHAVVGHAAPLHLVHQLGDDPGARTLVDLAGLGGALAVPALRGVAVVDRRVAAVPQLIALGLVGLAERAAALATTLIADLIAGLVAGLAALVALAAAVLLRRLA